MTIHVTSCDIITHCSEFVTVEDVEDFAVESDVNSEIEVLPVPESAQLIPGYPLPLYQLALGDAAERERERERERLFCTTLRQS